jgi:biotin-[acetyl-CoA-carboxylase] ligase BirA-like protein
MSAIHRFPRLGSTHAEALRRAAIGADPGTTIVAGEQMAGVGRLNHEWHSPPRGLYLSRIEADPGGPMELVPLGIALGLARWVETQYRLPTQIRWPNDLWVLDPAGKWAGVLADRRETPRGPRLIVGVGVNVAMDRRELPEPVRSTAAILQERVGPAISLAEVEATVLRIVPAAVRRLATPIGAAALVREAGERLGGIGEFASLDGVAVGRILGLAPDGALITELGGIRTLHRAGSLRLGGKPPGGDGVRSPAPHH